LGWKPVLEHLYRRGSCYVTFCVRFNLKKKMKGSKTSTFFQSLASFMVVYCFLTLDTRTILSPFINNPLTQIKEMFQHILHPSLERSVIKEPECFMTTVKQITSFHYEALFCVD
jgi:hypothetical protein